MPPVTRRRQSAETRAHEEQLSTWLTEKGWRRYPSGWRHPQLEWPWPMGDAVKLQVEADDGRLDLVCVSLRGDAWPP